MHFNILGRFGIKAGRAVEEDGVAFEDGTAVHRLSLSDDPRLACPSCGKLKEGLAERFPFDIEGYCFGKEGFVWELEEKALEEWGKRGQKALALPK